MARPFQLVQVAGAAVLGLLLCLAGLAQRGAVGGARMGAPARGFTSSRFSGTASRSFRIQPTTRSFSYGYTPAGLPFYYPNLPPLNGNVASRPSGFGTRGTGRRGVSAYVPIIWGGVPYYYDCLDTYINCLDESGDQQAYAAAVTQAPAPQVIVIQQPVPVAPASEDPSPSAAPAPSSPSSPAATPDTTGFVLIRHDGSVVFASAYSVIGNNIRYVTPEGIIRTMPLAQLDMDATRSMNEARGVALFPN